MTTIQSAWRMVLAVRNNDRHVQQSDGRWPLHQAFAMHVESRGCFIQNDHLWITDDRAGNGDALALAAG